MQKWTTIKPSAFSLFLRFIAGLAILLGVDLLAERYVFEWLEWNGTNKNDWFFMLWWVLVFAWVALNFHSIFQLNQNLRN